MSTIGENRQVEIIHPSEEEGVLQGAPRPQSQGLSPPLHSGRTRVPKGGL